MSSKKTLLMILDGWGKGSGNKADVTLGLIFAEIIDIEIFRQFR